MRIRGSVLHMLPATLVLFACDGDSGYVIAVAFDPPSIVDEVQRVELNLVGDCTAQDVYGGTSPVDPVAMVQVDRTSGSSGLGEIDPGIYGLYGRAWTDDCVVTAAGCADVRVEAGGSGMLSVTLAQVLGPTCEEGLRCDRSLCRVDEGCFEYELCDERDDDCDGQPDEDFLLESDEANCGGCGILCEASASSEVECLAGECVQSCLPGFGDCGGEEDDGCETDLREAPQHCGECGRVCHPPHAAGTCSLGECVLPSSACDAGYVDVDLLLPNGCERCEASTGSPCPWVCGDTLCDGAVAVATGKHHACALSRAGVVACWGENTAGERGDADEASRAVPAGVSDLSGVAEIGVGREHSCARTTSGDVYCWGSNSFGQLGSAQPSSSAPVQVGLGASTAVGLATGGYHTCTLTDPNQVLCWGANGGGQLGSGTTAESGAPGYVEVSDPDGAFLVAAGGLHTCAVVGAARTVKCWGLNNRGQLGDGTTSNSLVPTDVRDLAGVIALALGDAHSCAVLWNGTAHCWGANDHGELGNGSAVASSTPVQVTDVASALDVTVSGTHTCVRDVNGDVSCWGGNANGQLGNGTMIESAVPGPVTSLAPALDIAAGIDFSCAVAAEVGDEGAVYCWGSGGGGRLGLGAEVDAWTPAQVVSP